MEIRKAIATDGLLLSSLCMDVQTLHAEHHPKFFKMPKNEDFAISFFDELLANPMICIFIAEEKGQSLGYVICKLVEHSETPFAFAMRYLVVDHISVRPAAKGKGIGAALMERAEALARELNVERIHLNSWAFNTDAHSFFEKMGFEKFSHNFWKNM